MQYKSYLDINKCILVSGLRCRSDSLLETPSGCMLLSDLSTGQNKWKKSFPWHQRSSTCCAHYPGVVLCKSLGRGVPLEHWNSYPIREHDQLDFATMLLTRHQTPLPATLSQARYFHHCKNFITIVVQHTPTEQYLTKLLPTFNFYYTTLR